MEAPEILRLMLPGTAAPEAALWDPMSLSLEVPVSTTVLRAFGRVTAVWVLHRGSTINRSYFFIPDNPERETHSAPGPWRNIRRGR